jgi:hypothetical protein
MQSAFRFVAPVLARLPIVVNPRAFSLSEAIRAAGSAHPCGIWHPPTPTWRAARSRPEHDALTRIWRQIEFGWQ